MRSATVFLGWILVGAATLVSGAEVRLALVPTDSSLLPIVDVLTARLSRQADLVLLERVQVDRVYQELNLDAAQGNLLRLGQTLGADGLLILDRRSNGPSAELDLRLVAVKPGVGLRQRSYTWPLAELDEWSALVQSMITPLLPKLAVLPADAVPVSVLNLRSAVRSRSTESLETELTILLQNRLMQEPSFFVLERRRLGSLVGERELSRSDDEPFWTGAYLVEGTIDQQGFSTGNATIDLRIAPPGNAPVRLLRASGPRTNLAVLTESMARTVLEAIGRSTENRAWDPEHEATNYFEEARWALKWNMYEAAQAAADAAWALGRQDEATALLRVRSYAAAIPAVVGHFEQGDFSADVDDDRIFNWFIRKTLAEGPHTVFRRQGKRLQYATVRNLPSERDLSHGLEALSLYDQLSREHSFVEQGPESLWFREGVNALLAAGRVLQHFHAVPESQTEVAERLVQLRGMARQVAAHLLEHPAVQERYWPGGRLVAASEWQERDDSPSIVRCILDWGSFWQERPEDTITLYRRLLTSPAALYFQNRLWFPPPERPRLVSWPTNDNARLDALWQGMVREAAGSTNFAQQLTGALLELAEAPTSEAAEKPYAEFMATVFGHEEFFRTNHIEYVPSSWDIRTLIAGIEGGYVPPAKSRMEDHFRNEDLPRLNRLRDAHQAYVEQEKVRLDQHVAFERQANYLRAMTAYTSGEFHEVFRKDSYTVEQARELQPLLVAYRSNLLASVDLLPSRAAGERRMAASHVERVERAVAAALDPSLRPQRRIAQPSTAAPVVEPPWPSVSLALRDRTPPPPPLKLDQFVRLPIAKQASTPGFSNSVEGHHWRDRRLWLDLRISRDGSAWNRTGMVASFDPANGAWDLIPYPTTPTNFQFRLGHRFLEVHAGGLYLGGRNSVQRFDLKRRQWESLPVPGELATQLFVVNDRLYGLNAESIVELQDSGQRTVVLASLRRRPAVTALDSLPTLAGTVLMSGANDRLAALVGRQVYEWDSGEWRIRHSFKFPAREFTEAPPGDWILTPGSGGGFGGVVEGWSRSESGATWDLLLQAPDRSYPFYGNEEHRADDKPEEADGPVPRWKVASGGAPAEWVTTLIDSTWYVFADRSGMTNTSTGPVVLERNGRHADMWLIGPNTNEPGVVPLRFDLARGPLVNTSIRQRMGFAQSNPQLSWLVPTEQHVILGQEVIDGIWMIPRPALMKAAARRSRLIQDAGARYEELRQAAETELVARYDADANGRIERRERTEALADSLFLELELNSIDSNRDGLIGVAELSFFDVDGDRQLDPEEESGIRLAQAILAAEILYDFDRNHDGALEAAESVEPAELFRRSQFYCPTRWSQARPNDPPLKHADLARWLHSQTGRWVGGAASSVELRLQRSSRSNRPSDNRFSARIDLLWQHPDPPGSQVTPP